MRSLRETVIQVMEHVPKELGLEDSITLSKDDT